MKGPSRRPHAPSAARANSRGARVVGANQREREAIYRGEHTACGRKPASRFWSNAGRTLSTDRGAGD